MVGRRSAIASLKVEDGHLYLSLLEVFRKHGYGASIAELSAATGLQKASLYYRFPGGKAQMADETLGFVDLWFEENVFQPLRSDGDPAERVAAMCESIRVFYAGGSKLCLLEALSLGQTEGIIQDHLQATFLAWKRHLAGAILETGRDSVASEALAELMIAMIEGALVVRRLAPESDVFARTLSEILRLVEVS